MPILPIFEKQDSCRKQNGHLDSQKNAILRYIFHTNMWPHTRTKLICRFFNFIKKPRWQPVNFEQISPFSSTLVNFHQISAFFGHFGRFSPNFPFSGQFSQFWPNFHPFRPILSILTIFTKFSPLSVNLANFVQIPPPVSDNLVNFVQIFPLFVHFAQFSPNFLPFRPPR